MPTQDYMIKAFINSIQQNVEDVFQLDIDDQPISFRASKSYWVDYGWISDRWRDHGLPQIGVFHVGGGDVGRDTKTNRWELAVMQVDIFASGRQQKTDLAGQVKKGFYDWENRNSFLNSGVKFDSIVNEYDTIDDEVLPQKVFRKQLSFVVYFNSSGA